MAITIKPLRPRRRTTQRGKSMSQSQRWGKVVTTMPVPEGIISTSTGPSEVVQEVVPVEEVTEEPIVFDSDIDDPYEEVKDDLSQLS